MFTTLYFRGGKEGLKCNNRSFKNRDYKVRCSVQKVGGLKKNEVEKNYTLSISDMNTI